MSLETFCNKILLSGELDPGTVKFAFLGGKKVFLKCVRYNAYKNIDCNACKLKKYEICRTVKCLFLHRNDNISIMFMEIEKPKNYKATLKEQFIEVIYKVFKK